MKKITLLAVLIIFNQIYSQSNIEHKYTKILSELPTYGSSDFDYFPMCSDIIETYKKEKIEEVINSSEYILNKNTELDYNIDVDFNSAHNERIAKNSDDLEQTKVKFNQCFVNNTPVTAFYVDSETYKRFKLEINSKMSKIEAPVKNTSILNFLISKSYNPDSFIKDSGIPYILSSSVEMFPNTPRYHADCWSKVNAFYEGYVSHGKKIQTIGVKNQSTNKVTNLEVTSGHRFLTETCPEESECSWVRAENLDKGFMYLINATKNKQLCSITYTSDYTVEDKSFYGYGKDTGKTVYNLSTETHTYYVGDFENKVLVHNAK